MSFPTREAAALALERALIGEHLSACEQNDCDIRMAYEQGFPFASADLLSNATETPSLDAVLAQIPNWRAWAKAEAKTFEKWHAKNTALCPGCGGYVEFACHNQGILNIMKMDWNVVCSNCRTAFTVSQEVA